MEYTEVESMLWKLFVLGENIGMCCWVARPTSFCWTQLDLKMLENDCLDAEQNLMSRAMFRHWTVAGLTII